MNRTCLFCLLLLLVAAISNAQLFSSQTWVGDTGKLYLRMNSPGLMDVFDGNASAGGEVRLNKTWSVIMDAGYIFYSQYIARTKRASGLLLRPGVRLYAGKYRNMFVDMQLHYKGVRYYVNDWLGKDVVNSVATYEERKVFQARKRVYGGQIMIGGKEFLSSNYRLFLEFYIGFGLKYKEESLCQEPNSEYERGSGVFGSRILSSRKDTRVMPCMPAGIRLVYSIR